MSYVESFPLRDRLRDVLAWALVTGRLTDTEVEQVEAGLEGDSWAAYDAGWRQGRFALALLWPELEREPVDERRDEARGAA